ncbi:interleukin-6 receptor subunit alpha isoform X2 [Acanthopagrus latus]|uniref:interleukin-6 receptor subunit alpha isoform X2 n=1 Tax=Acanthopagrus latus TaxID=8177 RepID=UPI00187CD539|nr:interleukin-6 receptor subunit alpha isoform X2 [Acanthopagrus latus]
MRIFLPLLCAVCAPVARGIFDGTCLRKDPPPGVLVLSPGSDLVLTCSGHVEVDGVKVRNGSNTNRVGSSSAATPTIVSIITSPGAQMKSDTHTTENAVSQGYRSNPTEAGDYSSLRHTDTGYTASPTAHVGQHTGARRLLNTAETDGEEYEEDEASRVTRGIKWRSPWKLNKRTLGKGDSDQGGITFDRSGTSLSLSSVRVTDSGTYACFHRGRERFSLKVIVADPPGQPVLDCYKKSPSSKIRCASTPQKPNTVRPDCSLLLSKNAQPFVRRQCSYSSLTSRCWCALDHNEEERRNNHMAFLCITSIAGNTTSNLLQFHPLSIVKPDPPSNVMVRQIEGHETWLKVVWSLPTSWKSADNFYELIHEIKYRPDKSPFHQEQVHEVTDRRFCMITDAIPGVEYVIQLRTKEQYDGMWSSWSNPVLATTWTAPAATTTMHPVYTDTESSGDDYTTEGTYTKRDLCLNSTATVSSPSMVTHLNLSLRPLPRQLQKRRLW